jgi:hypothetical protein
METNGMDKRLRLPDLLAKCHQPVFPTEIVPEIPKSYTLVHP